MSEFDYFCVEVDIVFLVKSLILCFRFPKISEERFLLKVRFINIESVFKQKISHMYSKKTNTRKAKYFSGLKREIFFWK